MAPNAILQDVIAIIVCSDLVHNARAAVHKRLQSNGAKVLPRLTKDVTHVIFERRRSQRACDKRHEDEAVVELYRKLDVLPFPPIIVSPLWVEESITQGRRLMEKRYMVARPKESLLSAAPGSAKSNASGGALKKRKNRSSGPAPPKPAEEFDLNPSDWLFDSTKQLKEPVTGGPNPTDPLSGPKRHSRLRRTRSSTRTSGKLADAATAAVAGEATAGIRVGTATQAVADILAIDLPADREWSENGNEDDDLDTPLSVRMARQSSGKRQKVSEPSIIGGASTAGKAGAKSTGGTRKSRLANSSKATEENPVVVVEEKKEEAEKKPETQEEEEDDEIEDDYDMDVDEALATQQAVVEEKEPTPAPKPKPKTKPAPKARKQQTKNQTAPPVAVRFSMRNLHPERPMLVHKGTPLVPIKSVSTARANGRAQVIPIPEAVRVNSPWNEPTPAATTAANKARRPGSAAPLTFTKPRVSFGGFAVHTASKPGAALVGGYGGGSASNVSTPTLPTTLKKVVNREKVPTPWCSPRPWDAGHVEAAADANSSSQQTGGKPSSQQNQRRSRFGTQNDEEQKAAAARALEEAPAEDLATMPEPEEVEEAEVQEDVVMMDDVANNEAKIPSFVPASDNEEEEEVDEEENIVVDDQKEDVEAEAEEEDSDEEQQEEDQENACENLKKPNNKGIHGGSAAEKKKRKSTTTRRAATEEVVEAVVEVEAERQQQEPKKAEKKKKDTKEEQSPKHGCIAITSTTSGVVALCKSAVQRLRGLRLCAEGKEDGTITHLIIGDERRTMKAMLAVANGAILLDPEWITASLEAGKWVPEGPYKSKVRFAAAADRAREQKSASTKLPALLSEHSIHIHPGQGNPAALKRVAMALGASITSLKDCSVCVVSGRDGEKPNGVPRQVPVVSEEWLLAAAETFRVPSMKKYFVK